jgi:AcrR family transcriptional regulator
MGIVERRQREREQREIDILEAARTVFAEKGFKRATVNDIAREAQFSPGTLYLYFKNKEEFYTALAIDMLRNMTQENQKIAQQDSFSTEEKLSTLKKTVVKMYEYDPEGLINLFHLQSADRLSELSPGTMKQIKKLSSQSMQAIAAIIRDGMEEGLFRRKHPMAVADMIWGISSGIILWGESKHQLNPGKNFVLGTLEAASDIFFEGLKLK